MAPRTTDWVVGRRRAPFYVADPAPGYRPHLLLCLDLGSDKVHAAEVIAPDETAEAAAETLSRAMAKALAKGAPPRIRTDSEDLAAPLRELLPATVTIDVGPAGELDAVVETFGDWSSEREVEADPDYLENGRIPPGAVRRFFEAASRLYRAAPWTRIESDSQLLRLQAAWAGFEDGCVSVIGTLGEHRGLALFESVEDFRAFARLIDEIDFSDGDRRRGPGVPMLSVHFDPAKSLSGVMRAQVKEHRWPAPGAKAYPWVLRMDDDGVRRPLTTADYTLAAACADAVVDLFERHAALFTRQEPEPVTVAHRIDHEGETAELRLTAPCPGLDWEWLDDTATNAVRREESEAIVDEHLDALRAEGAAGGDVDECGELLDHLWRYKIEALNEPPWGWTADHVEDFLLDYFPSEVALEAPAVERAPARLDAFFAWLEASGYERADDVAEIRARIGRLRTEFEKRALDPSNHGTAKAVLMQMRREGVDASDKGAMSRFIDRFNERLKDERAAPNARVRWTPPPGETPPGPADPCPCGSGRRYKKCCMRR